jgi:hypothetical protein
MRAIAQIADLLIRAICRAGSGHHRSLGNVSKFGDRSTACSRELRLAAEPVSFGVCVHYGSPRDAVNGQPNSAVEAAYLRS